MPDNGSCRRSACSSVTEFAQGQLEKAMNDSDRGLSLYCRAGMAILVTAPEAADSVCLAFFL